MYGSVYLSFALAPLGVLHVAIGNWVYLGTGGSLISLSLALNQGWLLWESEAEIMR
jgi:hypothetical protein